MQLVAEDLRTRRAGMKTTTNKLYHHSERGIGASQTENKEAAAAVTTHVLLAAPCYAFPGYAYIYSPEHPVRLHMPACQVGGPASFDTTPLAHTQNLMANYQLELIKQLSEDEEKGNTAEGKRGGKPHPAYDFRNILLKPEDVTHMTNEKVILIR